MPSHHLHAAGTKKFSAPDGFTGPPDSVRDDRGETKVALNAEYAVALLSARRER
jgi:hypothetical protein